MTISRFRRAFRSFSGFWAVTIRSAALPFSMEPVMESISVSSALRLVVLVMERSNRA